MRIARQFVFGLVALAFLVAIAAAHLFQLDQASRLADTLVNSLHGPGFAAVAIVVFAVLRIFYRGPFNYLQAGAIAMTIGLLSEIAQIPGPRDADIRDLIKDGVGVVAGLGLIAMLDKEQLSLFRLRSRLLLKTTVIIAVLATAVPTAWYAYALIRQHQAAPEMLTFDHQWEAAVTGWSFHRRSHIDLAPTDWPEPRSMVAYARAGGRWGTIVRIYPFPDWTRFSKLGFVAASDSDDEQDVYLFVHDIAPNGQGERNQFMKKLVVGKDPSRHEISLEDIRLVSNGRPFDISHVESVILSSVDRDSDVTFVLDDFRLE